MASRSKQMNAENFALLCSEINTKYAGSEDKMPVMRDIALLALNLCAGISISACSVLNVDDIDTDKKSLRLTTKDRTTILLYPDHIANAISEYIEARRFAETDARALFLGRQNGRMPPGKIKEILSGYKEITDRLGIGARAASGSKAMEKQEFDELIKKLPPFCKTYFVGISQRTTALTRLNYARDLGVFFNFLKSETEEFAGVEPADFTLRMLNDVTPGMIEQFLFYITDYNGVQKTGTEIERTNDIQAKARKLSAISSMYKYFMLKQQIATDPVGFVEKPKKRDNAIIRLDPAEVANLLDAIESGEGQTENQKKRNAPLVLRDVAIMTLFLGTGIRISECTGINIKDIDFAERAVLITRKGQKKQVVYYGDEVEDALGKYLEERLKIKPEDGDEDALFLSNQNKRITNRAVQMLVKKYAGIVTPLKHITPHKLRSTFGTNLYQETGDIYLVATVLGHSDVNTTRKHYAQNSEDMRVNAVKKIRLRDKEDE